MSPLDVRPERDAGRANQRRRARLAWWGALLSAAVGAILGAWLATR